MKTRLLLCSFVLAVTVTSCSESTPTQNNPPTGPAQLAVQVAVSQATAATNIGATGPAKQAREVNYTVTVTNADMAATASIEDVRIFGSILAGQDPYPFDVTTVPQPPNNTVPASGSATINGELEVDIDPPFQVGSVFDLFAEVTYTDVLGNSGTTPAVSTAVDPALTLRPPGGCTQGIGVDCVDIGGQGRFRVEVQWAEAGSQAPQPGTTDQQFNDGAFWLVGSDDTQLLVQLIDQCGNDDHFWVFFAATTNIEIGIVIEDTQTHVVKEYRNPLGTAFQPLQDTSAFATCPGPVPVP